MYEQLVFYNSYEKFIHKKEIEALRKIPFNKKKCPWLGWSEIWKQNRAVIFFLSILLYAIVCDCCFTVEWEKRPVNNKCTGNNLGEWSTPGGLLVYLIAKLQLKCFVYTCYLADFISRNLTFGCVSNVLKNAKLTPSYLPYPPPYPELLVCQLYKIGE